MTRLRRILVLTTARLALPAIIGLSLASSSAQAQIGVLAPAGTANPMAATQTSIQGIFTDVQNTGTLFRSGATQMAGGGQSMLGGGMGSELRHPLGVVMVGGLIVSQLLTLFTTPVIYLGFAGFAEQMRVRREGRGAVA